MTMLTRPAVPAARVSFWQVSLEAMLAVAAVGLMISLMAATRGLDLSVGLF